MTLRIGEQFEQWKSPEPGEGALGVAGFSIFPHLDYPTFPENTLAHAERWAERIDGPAYAIDDQSAVRVVGGDVDVLSEGQWKRLK